MSNVDNFEEQSGILTPQHYIPHHNTSGLKDRGFLELKYLAKLPSIHEGTIEEEVLRAEAKEIAAIQR
jgi:hypothetical protein